MVIFHYGFYLFSLEWLSLIWNAFLLIPLPHCTCHLIACYILAPISNPFGENWIKKKTLFWPFFPPSFISLFHTRSTTMKNVPTIFIFVLDSLNLSENEIKILVYKFHTRKTMERCRAILLLFMLVIGFEKASLRYRVMTFLDRMDYLQKMNSIGVFLKFCWWG